MLLCFSLAGKLGFAIANGEFALNSTRSSSTRISSAYIVFGHEPTLPLEHALHVVNDGPV